MFDKREWYRKNKEKLDKQKRDWYLENKERINNRRRLLYKTNEKYHNDVANKNKEYQSKNKDVLYKRRKKYYVDRYESLKFKMSIYSKKRNNDRRQRIIKYLGGKCVRCGFSDWRALQVDHVNGGGCEERKKISSFHYFLEKILENNNGKYQLLCANCNWIKKYERNETTSKY